VQMLNQQGLSGKFRFVGTQRSSCTGIGSNGGHEGYPAYKATTSPRGPKGKIGGIGGEWDDEKENLLPKVMAKNEPDIVLILLGINDMVIMNFTFQKFYVADCMDRLLEDHPLKSLRRFPNSLTKCEQLSRE
jgi:lysophospholipase L1-like esterase